MTGQRLHRWIALAALAFAAAAGAQTLYKYRGADGEWIYSDRPPDKGEQLEETRALAIGEQRGGLSVTTRATAAGLEFVASNAFYAPVQVALRFQTITGFEFPDPDADLVWVVPPRGEQILLALGARAATGKPAATYEYEYMVGEPRASHRPDGLYRVPFAIATDFTITQAYPDVITHQTPDSFHAIDIAMPIGTDIFAARGGIVFDVASQNFKGGTDREEHGRIANVVQILHDDGTFALYAHLNWNSIRVRPGQRVERGEYIADSGNTGFSSGPHLHFAVLRNRGLELESLPVRFEGADSSAVVPATGAVLTAY